MLTHEVESSTNESETICEAHEAAFDDTDKDAKTLISEYRTKNKDKVVLATLNINSLRNKFTSLMELVSGNIDILVIEETKIDSTFPEAQFCIPGYKKPFRKDRNAHGGGIIVYVREDIPSRELNSFKIDEGVEGMFIEINLRKSKWLVLATYKPPDHSKEQYFDFIRNSLDFYSEKYKNIILMGDFNINHTEEELQDFLEEQDLSNLVNFSTCFKNLDNPSTIDLIITNHKSSFQNTVGVSTGLSDFHKMVITSMKTTFPKCPPKVKTYRDMR